MGQEGVLDQVDFYGIQVNWQIGVPDTPTNVLVLELEVDVVEGDGTGELVALSDHRNLSVLHGEVLLVADFLNHHLVGKPVLQLLERVHLVPEVEFVL